MDSKDKKSVIKCGLDRENEMRATSKNARYGIWSPTRSKNIVYHLATKDLKADEIDEAAKRWEAVCNVKFVLRTTEEEVAFSVIHEPGEKGVFARMHFPTEIDKDLRLLKLFDTFFGVQVREHRVNILTHELGHSLGFRHPYHDNPDDTNAREINIPIELKTNFQEIMSSSYDQEKTATDYKITDKERLQAIMLYGFPQTPVDFDDKALEPVKGIQKSKPMSQKTYVVALTDFDLEDEIVNVMSELTNACNIPLTYSEQGADLQIRSDHEGTLFFDEKAPDWVNFLSSLCDYIGIPTQSPLSLRQGETKLNEVDKFWLQVQFGIKSSDFAYQDKFTKVFVPIMPASDKTETKSGSVNNFTFNGDAIGNQVGNKNANMTNHIGLGKKEKKTFLFLEPDSSYPRAFSVEEGKKIGASYNKGRQRPFKAFLFQGTDYSLSEPDDVEEKTLFECKY